MVLRPPCGAAVPVAKAMPVFGDRSGSGHMRCPVSSVIIGAVAAAAADRPGMQLITDQGGLGALDDVSTARGRRWRLCGNRARAR